MGWYGLGKSIGFAIGKTIAQRIERERQACIKTMLKQEEKLAQQLWREVKDRIRSLSDEEFEELAQYINAEVCTGSRRYKDARHEVYSKLKYDCISYQYEKILKYLEKNKKG